MSIAQTGALALSLFAAAAASSASAFEPVRASPPRKLVAATGDEPILYSVDWSPDGRELACQVRESRMVFVDARTGRPSRKPWIFTKPLGGVALSPDWRRAAVTDSGGRVRLYDVRSRRSLRILPGVSKPQGLAWSRDGRRLAVTLDRWVQNEKRSQGGVYPLQLNRKNRILIFDAGTGLLQKTLSHISRDGMVEGHDFGGFEAAWSPDGRRLATVLIRSGRMRESPVHLWEAKSGKLLRQWGRLRSQVGIHEGTDCFNAPAWKPDGQVLAATDGDRLWIWEARTGRIARLLKLDHPVQQIAWSPDGRILAARTFPDYWGSDEGFTARIYLWDGRTHRRLRTLSVPERGLYAMAWSPDSRHLAATDRNGVIRVWDP